MAVQREETMGEADAQILRNLERNLNQERHASVNEESHVKETLQRLFLRRQASFETSCLLLRREKRKTEEKVMLSNTLIIIINEIYIDLRTAEYRPFDKKLIVKKIEAGGGKIVRKITADMVST